MQTGECENLHPQVGFLLTVIQRLKDRASDARTPSVNQEFVLQVESPSSSEENSTSSVCGFLFYLISFVSRYIIFRFHGEDGSKKDDCSTAERETIKFEDSDSDEPKFCFKFQFQNLQDTKRENEESESSVPTEEETPMVNTSKYQFLYGKDFCGFMEEPEVVNFTVNELYADSNYGSFSNKEIVDGEFLSEKDLPQLDSQVEAIQEEIVENSVTESHCKAGEKEPETVTQEQLSGKEESVDSFSNKETIDGGFLSEENLPQLNSQEEAIQEEIVENSAMDSNCHAGEKEPETMTQEQLSGKEESVGSFSDSEEDLPQFNSQTEAIQEEIVANSFTESHCKAGETELETLSQLQLSDKEELENFEVHSQNKEDVSTEIQFMGEEDFFASDSEQESISSSDEFSLEDLSFDPTDGFLSDTDFEKPSQEKQPHSLKSRRVDIGILSDSDMEDENEEEEEEEEEENEKMDISGKTEEPNDKQNLQKTSMAETEDENELETLWEHQDLIEQLKMELKKVRATGLPTILEESESPRVMEDLKPWKIDEKFLHEDRMDELHKFYKSYRERMRKFDIFNYQKMYAIGFLQLKDPLQSMSNRKSSIPSILSQNFWLGKNQRAKVDPTVKFIGELQSDLEMVYVGHMCLSWEILHWQFGKAHELQESDPYGFHRYNHVAGEFQQFQVLMQRFLENEAFQGPRVQNYVKNRCVLRNLLQVPVIKEDSYKDKKKSKRVDNDAITIPMLTVIIEESMQIFWEFVKADKNEGSVILKGLWRTQVELQNPEDLELLTQIRRNILKKEKKLKDILRTGNCLVKRFKKRHEDRLDLVSFFSQVDMKLISRVLNMSRITSEQLSWCDKKLNKINFVNRKIHREPSFLLFPC
ncbi:hypothetical protein NE237_007477 [Protea cynaroides]|uniref:Ribosomal protein L34Ae n=1 Tax=Protea cynaroides TaxID=273540 RepID=A0A9Q0KPC6_9MAGN|nr:hypothetical protein NE237_007477 [Protea cynaroides]